MYEPRTYRNNMGEDRFCAITVSFLETDLWIGIDRESFSSSIPGFIENRIRERRKELEDYILNNKAFLKSLTPLPDDINAPAIAQKMIRASAVAGTGPMSAVAGVFAEDIGRAVKNKFNIKEIVVENGGDIYLYIQEPLVVTVYAGNSPLSEKVGIKVMPEYSPLGICCSSGTIGHSLSFGKADAAMIACRDTSLADAYATAFGNKIKNEQDIDFVIKEIEGMSNILSAVLICGKKMGICGKFKMVFT